MLLKNGSLENRAARLWTVWIILVALILVALVAAVSLVPRAVAEEKAAGIQNAAAKPKGDGSDSKKVADLKIRSTTTMPVELSEAETKCLRGRRAIASGEFIIDEHGLGSTRSLPPDTAYLPDGKIRCIREDNTTFPDASRQVTE